MRAGPLILGGVGLTLLLSIAGGADYFGEAWIPLLAVVVAGLATLALIAHAGSTRGPEPKNKFYCGYCGEEIAAGTVHCPYCGGWLADPHAPHSAGPHPSGPEDHPDQIGYGPDVGGIGLGL